MSSPVRRFNNLEGEYVSIGFHRSEVLRIQNQAIADVLNRIEGLQYGPYGSDAEYIHKQEERIAAIRAEMGEHE